MFTTDRVVWTAEGVVRRTDSVNVYNWLSNPYNWQSSVSEQPTEYVVRRTDRVNVYNWSSNVYNWHSNAHSNAW